MSDDTIEIMTIHKAKGLERKVVIIPNCKWDTAPRGNLNQVIWAQADNSSDIASIGEFPVIYRKTMQQSAFTEDYYKELTMSHIDAVNLLYVALTRASEELYVFTPQRLNAKSLSDDITTIVPLMVDAASKVCGEGVTLSDEEGIKQITYSFGRKVTSNSSTQSTNVANDHLLAVRIRFRLPRLTASVLRSSPIALPPSATVSAPFPRSSVVAAGIFRTPFATASLA